MVPNEIGYEFLYVDASDSALRSTSVTLPSKGFETGVDGTNGCFAFNYALDPEYGRIDYNKFEVYTIPVANCTELYGEKSSADKICVHSFFQNCFVS